MACRYIYIYITSSVNRGSIPTNIISTSIFSIAQLLARLKTSVFTTTEYLSLAVK